MNTRRIATSIVIAIIGLTVAPAPTNSILLDPGTGEMVPDMVREESPHKSLLILDDGFSLGQVSVSDAGFDSGPFEADQDAEGSFVTIPNTMMVCGGHGHSHEGELLLDVERSFVEGSPTSYEVELTALFEPTRGPESDDNPAVRTLRNLNVLPPPVPTHFSRTDADAYVDYQEVVTIDIPHGLNDGILSISLTEAIDGGSPQDVGELNILLLQMDCTGILDLVACAGSLLTAAWLPAGSYSSGGTGGSGPDHFVRNGESFFRWRPSDALLATAIIDEPSCLPLVATTVAEAETNNPTHFNHDDTGFLVTYGFKEVKLSSKCQSEMNWDADGETVWVHGKYWFPDGYIEITNAGFEWEGFNEILSIWSTGVFAVAGTSESSASISGQHGDASFSGEEFPFDSTSAGGVGAAATAERDCEDARAAAQSDAWTEALDEYAGASVSGLPITPATQVCWHIFTPSPVDPALCGAGTPEGHWAEGESFSYEVVLNDNPSDSGPGDVSQGVIYGDGGSDKSFYGDNTSDDESVSVSNNGTPVTEKDSSDEGNIEATLPGTLY